MRSSFYKIVGLSGLLLTQAVGCVATVRTRPVYAEYESYPQTYYDGQTVYYFDGYWHYRTGNSWVVAYREEPPVLYRYRSSGRVHNAPSAAPREYHRRDAPPTHRHTRRSAPPAERYR